MLDIEAQRSLALVFGRELESIKSTYHDVWSLKLEVSLQAARLYLYALCFTTEHSLASNINVTQLEPAIPTQLILHQALAAASRLISNTSELLKSTSHLPTTITHSPHATSGSSHLIFYPKPYFTSLYFAAVFLLKFLVAEPYASQTDRELALSHVTTAHNIFSVYSCSRDHKRGAMQIEVLGRMARSGGLHAGLYIKSRLGASLMYDATLMANLSRHRNPETSELAPAHAVLKLSSVGPLPPAPEQLAEHSMGLSSNTSGSPMAETCPNSEQFMQTDQGWAWGMWSDEIYDSLALGDGI